MTIYLNDEKLELEQSFSLQQILLEKLQITPEKKGIAVAVNETIIPKHQWAFYQLQNNDRILVIIAAQGG
ncbi:MAG: hypothetical protein KatS3mg027_1530 [Bacteroidia bacterium]|nr:MAG: hypothetical protein KatS3mg027_1530 [Bacteroidia bacterium]